MHKVIFNRFAIPVIVGVRRFRRDQDQCPRRNSELLVCDGEPERSRFQVHQIIVPPAQGVIGFKGPCNYDGSGIIH